MQALNALVKLCGCAGSSDSLPLAYAIRHKYQNSMCLLNKNIYRGHMMSVSISLSVSIFTLNCLLNTVVLHSVSPVKGKKEYEFKS